MNRKCIHVSLAFLAVLTSCMHTRTIERNYEFAKEIPCDCYIKHPLLLLGTRSNYYSKESAFCTSLDFAARKDSVITLETLKYQLEENLEEDSIRMRINLIEEQLRTLKSSWTHTKIKTKWRNSPEGIQVIRQKVKFYNRFHKGRKLAGVRKYKNNVLVRSKLKE